MAKMIFIFLVVFLIVASILWGIRASTKKQLLSASKIILFSLGVSLITMFILTTIVVFL